MEKEVGACTLLAGLLIFEDCKSFWGIRGRDIKNW